MSKIRSITLCSSVSFYKQAIEIGKRLEALGFSVWIGRTAETMAKTGNWNVRDYKQWYRDKSLFKDKAKLMMLHFRAVERADSILVVNLSKKGIAGYIGGNVLMEMAIAFFLHKPIFLLNPVSSRNPLYEEIMGTIPVIIAGDLKRIK